MPVLRLIHRNNLETLVARAALHAPSTRPRDGLPYRAIHEPSVQAKRGALRIPCGPGGTVDDYVSFYFGPLSPMLLRLRAGDVPGFQDAQETLLHLVADARAIARAGLRFVFSNGHALATATRWFEDLEDLNRIDWSIVAERYWGNTSSDHDRRRRKQAEFLVHRVLPWGLVEEIAVMNVATARRVERSLAAGRAGHRPEVRVRPEWYYP